jgi:hypothetical protein
MQFKRDDKFFVVAIHMCIPNAWVDLRRERLRLECIVRPAPWP